MQLIMIIWMANWWSIRTHYECLHRDFDCRAVYLILDFVVVNVTFAFDYLDYIVHIIVRDERIISNTHDDDWWTLNAAARICSRRVCVCVFIRILLWGLIDTWIDVPVLRVQCARTDFVGHFSTGSNAAHNANPFPHKMQCTKIAHKCMWLHLAIDAF